jgi:hypothetical protein
VTTSVVDAVAPGSHTGAFVGLQSNSGPVSVEGNSSTEVQLGEILPNGIGFTTAGIQANVTVTGVAGLVLADSGNATTQEQVTVTEKTISGTGLFGNDAVTVTYGHTGDVIFLTGQLADTYTVVGSKPGAFFGCSISLNDVSNVGLSVFVALDGGSGLHLSLSDSAAANPVPASLFISAPQGTYSNPTPNLPSGSENVTFDGGLTSEVDYTDCTSVTLS